MVIFLKLLLLLNFQSNIACNLIIFFMFKYLFLLFSIASHAQILHHQAISSLGSSVKMTNGTYVSQTIGQFGALSSYSNSNLYVQQGFQQSIKNNSSQMLTKINSMGIITKMYPNPVVTTLNFEFSKDFTNTLIIEIFDLSGRTIYREEKNQVGRLLSLDLSQFLFQGFYIIKLFSSNYNYTNKFLKL